MLKNFITFLIFFCICTSANAKKIKIISDELEIIRISNTSIFYGNVYALEDNLQIWSEKLIVTSSDDEKKIEEITALGNVKIARDELTINGSIAKYDPAKNILIAYGKVEVIQNNNIIQCDEIILDLEKSSSIMKSGSNRRVEALIVNE